MATRIDWYLSSGCGIDLLLSAASLLFHVRGDGAGHRQRAAGRSCAAGGGGDSGAGGERGKALHTDI